MICGDAIWRPRARNPKAKSDFPSEFLRKPRRIRLVACPCSTPATRSLRRRWSNFHSEDDLMTRAALLPPGRRVRGAADRGDDYQHRRPPRSSTRRSLARRSWSRSARASARTASEGTSTVLDCHNTEMPGLIGVRGSRLEDVLEGVALEEPRLPRRAPAATAGHRLLAPRRPGRRLSRLQCGPGAPQRHHRPRHHGGHGRHAGNTPIHSSPPGVIGCPRPSSARGRAIPPTTKSGMAPANSPIYSPARPMPSFCQ